MKSVYGFFILLTLILAACSVQKTLAKYEDTRIIFGNGGGYSGQEMQYTLTPDGNIELYDNISRKTTLVSKLSKKETARIFDEMEEVILPGSDFNHPGNTYSFVRQVKDNKTYNIVWGARQPEVPSRIQAFHGQLMSLVE